MYVIQNPFEDQTLHSTLYLKKLNLLSYWKLSCLLPFLLKALLPSFILTEGSLAFFHSYWRLSCLLPFLLKALLPSFILTEGSLAFFHFLLCPEWVCVCVWLVGQSQSFPNLFLRKHFMNVVSHNSHLGKCFPIPYLHKKPVYPDKTFVSMLILDA